MLSNFPTPYPDELLYSVFARYYIQSGNSSYKTALKELYGYEKIYIAPDFPSNLSCIFKRLENFGTVNHEDIIREHTPFLYFTSFLHKRIKKTIYEGLFIPAPKMNGIHYSSGQVPSTVKESKYFKFCTECLKEDILQYGETYWRMSFQLPSVLFCPQHQRSLYYSSVIFRQKKLILVPATELNCFIDESTQCVDGSLSINEEELFITIARESIKLSKTNFDIDFEKLRKLYKRMLRAKGFITSSQRVRQSRLRQNFIDFFGARVLNLLQSYPSDKEHCWLKVITRKKISILHPIRHLLMMHYLGISVDSLNFGAESHPFEYAPYPCLNIAAKHYKQRVITDIDIKRCTETGNPIGVFRCSCGFIYTRLGPDNDEGSMYLYRSVKEYGEEWINKVIEYVDVSKHSFRATAKLLNVDTNTVIKNYKLEKGLLTTKEKDNSHNDKNTQSYRNSWLELIKDNPEAISKELRKLNSALYMKLYRNDKDWLARNSPKLKIQKTEKIIYRVDWKTRDEQILLKIKNYLLIERKYKLKTNRRSKKSVGLGIGCLSLIEKHLNKMPLTKLFLQSIVEEKWEHRENLKLR
ncbi:TnsD family transposase [Bacillus sp. 31A1R]|uniref:TnsD family transposase n=1 Tax=Robertmurraya mangrovi TaxID=3098077 RepID=A0ABU5J432_9BACI|nr:TnsD family transposase [Bacillus sp. 31A1R]MDZ5474186.1 TnsD family transposase [Bacillus sp. 31A1R]